MRLTLPTPASKILITLIRWLITRVLYNIHVVAPAPLTAPSKPTLYLANHLSFVDGLMIGSCLPHPLRYVMLDRYYHIRWLNPLLQVMGVIPMYQGGKAMVRSLQQAREALLAGDSVCLFPEGVMSRNGNMTQFRAGFEKIVKGVPEVQIIPVHLDGMWGSMFSGAEGKFITKWPRRLRHPVTISFGQPMPSSSKAFEVQQAVMELGAHAYPHRPNRPTSLALGFVKSAKRHSRRLAILDSTGRQLSYGRALTAALLLAGILRRQYPSDPILGIALPASAGGALINLGCSLAGKTPLNINFTAGLNQMAASLAQCGVTTLITSPKLLEKFALPDTRNRLLIEELLAGVSLRQKAAAWLMAYGLPSWLLTLWLRARVAHGDDLATVLFSSGSTGTPKGVRLSQTNLLANIDSIATVLPLKPGDVMMGVLPLFHSFGFTGTLWLPLLRGFAVAYHPNPLDGKTVGKMVAAHQAKLLITTPTFAQIYTRSCDAEQLQSLRYCVVGAEKLRPLIAADFKAKFGMDLLEGYGCTELSPVVAVNLPDLDFGGWRHVGHQPGTVGHPIPGIAARITDPESGAVMGVDAPGMLWIKGANVMQGYHQQPDLTAAVLQDGWYQTGDIAKIDAAGFITLVDRLSRFAKLGGEMVPLGAVEEALQKASGQDSIVATVLSDPQKGERIIIAHVEDLAVEDLLKALQATLPPLWIPGRNSFVQLDTIPLLSTGKLDLQGVKQAVAQRLGG
jgi:acyl-[acyl-carrier-protein]-phospholipid O-acyltransferase/long-chain-fatty-acid--[acyl-carrier-protein] ligase